MATEIRSKDYSFPEAFNAVGKKLVPGWTGDEIHARKCRSPEDVDSAATRPERHLKFMKENPGLVAKDWPIRIADAEALFQERQSGPLKQEIEDLKQDPEAYQERYDLWSRRYKAEKPFNDIMHHDHADGWIETPEGNILEIEPTHWGVRGGPFIPPQLPGTLGEYKGETGEVRIGKERLDAYLRTLAAGRKTRGEQDEATRQKTEMWTRAIVACEQKHLDWTKSRVLIKVADDLDINIGSLKRRMYDTGGHWSK